MKNLKKQLADKIVNTINEDFNLKLFTVDSFAMSEAIILILNDYNISSDSE